MKDAPKNIILQCRDFHVSIIEYPKQVSDFKCRNVNCICPSAVTIDISATILMQTHYNEQDLMTVKAETDKLIEIKKQLLTLKRLPVTAVQDLLDDVRNNFHNYVATEARMNQE